MQVLWYDAESGNFIWKVSTSNRVNIGSIAGNINSRGYIQIRIDNKTYYAHRLVWMYAHGNFPELSIDHIDGNKLNNKLSNIRPCNQSENLRNIGKHISNTSGFKGVYWNKQKSKWHAKARLTGKVHHIGLFDSPELASEAYQKFARSHHGDFYYDK